MGIYIFKSKHESSYKVGSCSGSNAWRRLTEFDMNTTQHPKTLTNKLSHDDMELVRWYPTIKYAYETNLHNKFRQYKIIGEWYDEIGFQQISEYLDNQYLSEHEKCDLQEALTKYPRIKRKNFFVNPYTYTKKRRK